MIVEKYKAEYASGLTTVALENNINTIIAVP